LGILPIAMEKTLFQRGQVSGDAHVILTLQRKIIHIKQIIFYN